MVVAEAGARIFIPPRPDLSDVMAELRAVRNEMRSASVGSASSASQFGPAIEAYRAFLDEGMPTKAARLFEKLLKEHSASLTALDTFRVKVNLGLCYWLVDEREQAARLIEEGCDAAPNEPKAIANRTLAILLREGPEAAFEYAKRELASDPENELLASHLFRVALEQPGFQDPTDLVPLKLRECESVLLLRTLFLRNKEVRPLWWEVATNASKSFPENKTLALFSAEAVIDRNILSNLDRSRLSLGEPYWPEIKQSLAVLEAHWERIRTSENADSEEGLSILSSQMIARRLLGDRDGAIRIARDLIGRSTNEKIVTNAVGIAITFDDSNLAEAGLAKLPAKGRSEFYRGIFAFNRGAWGKAAEHFKGADCPQEESALVAAIIRLAPAADPQPSVGSDELEELERTPINRYHIRRP